VKHTDEYNFTSNPYYPKAASEFTMQMTVHPTGITTGKLQILAAKPGEWRLLINSDGKLEWHVKLISGWVVASGTRVLKPAGEASQAYVVKATHAHGTVKIFSCALGSDFRCPLGPTPEGSATGSCTGPEAVFGTIKTPTCVSSDPTADIIIGAEQDCSHHPCGVKNGFVGAMEEIFLSRLSLENITAHLFSCPACECNNFYIW
jgi:hypothetical protein